MIPVDIQSPAGFIHILSGVYVPPFSSASFPQIKSDTYYLLYCIDGKGRVSLGKETGISFYFLPCHFPCFIPARQLL